MSDTETWSLIEQRNKLLDEVDRLRTRLVEVEGERESAQKLREDNKSLLERLKEAEMLLSSVDAHATFDSGNATQQWRKRRDAFLNPTNKDVK